MTYLARRDFFVEIARNNVPEMQDYSGFGLNEDVDTGTTPEDVWTTGGVFVPPTTNRIHAIVSTSANDTSAGTGARTVKVYGVTTAGLANEVVTLNGVTPVNTVNSYLDIYIMYVNTAGSGATNVGAITATAATDATVTIIIQANGLNTSRKSIRLIPTGFRGLLFDWSCAMQQNTASSFASMALQTMQPSGVFITRSFMFLNNTGDSSAYLEFKVPLVIEAGTWVRTRCTSVTNNNTLIRAGFNLILEEV